MADLIGGFGPAAIYGAAPWRRLGWRRGGGPWDLARLDATGFHGPVVEVRRTTLQAAVAALEGRRSDALELYRDALRGWSELGITWDAVLTAIDMATVLDPSEPEVRAAAMATRETLVGLRAQPFLERLDARWPRPVRRSRWERRVTCTNCGTANPSGLKFSGECGTRVRTR